jgi:hypothetical protein
MQWLLDSKQSNVDNLNNVREGRQEGISEAKINGLETNSKNKNIRDFIVASMTLRRVTSCNNICN